MKVIRSRRRGCARSSRRARSWTERLMNETSETCAPASSGDSPSTTSSPASADGASPSGSPSGQTTARCGPAVVRANLSARQARARGWLTSGTCGLTGTGSSSSADLGSSLVSRLKRRLDTAGSILFTLTWKVVATPAGRSVCLLRASGRSTSERGSGSWPSGWRSPDHSSRGGDYQDPLKVFQRIAQGHQINLADQAVVANWPTPDAALMNDAADPILHQQRRDRLKAKWHNGNGAGLPLGQAAHLAAWPSPMTGSPKTAEYNAAGDTCNGRKTRLLVSWATPLKADGRGSAGRGKQELPNQARMTAWATPAATASTGQLNPAFSLWLMGFDPVAWLLAAPSSKPAPRFHQKTPRTSSAASAPPLVPAMPSAPPPLPPPPADGGRIAPPPQLAEAPAHRGRSVGELAVAAGWRAGTLLRVVRDSVLLLAQIGGLRIVSDGLPAVVEDVVNRAQRHFVDCGECNATGKVMSRPTKEKPESVEVTCPLCLGPGKLIREADPERQQMVLEMAKLLAKGGGAQIAIQQNVGSAAEGKSGGGAGGGLFGRPLPGPDAGVGGAR